MDRIEVDIAIHLKYIYLGHPVLYISSSVNNQTLFIEDFKQISLLNQQVLHSYKLLHIILFINNTFYGHFEVCINTPPRKERGIV